MIKKIDHIGIAVKDLSVTASIFEKILGTTIYKKEIVASEGVCTHFLNIGDVKIELLESISAENAITKFIDKKGEGIQHLAIEVDDIYSEMNRMKALGFELLNETPKVGADQKMICFLHPKTTGGVLIELVQTISEL